MADLSQFDPNSVGLLSNNVFGLPFSEEDAKLVLLPVPWEVTVSYSNGTARGPEHIFKASLQVDLYDADVKDGWKQGFYMREPDKHLLLRSDYLRKEAELYLKFLTEGGDISENEFLKKTLVDVNNGTRAMNEWVYTQTKALLEKGKLVGLVGGDHSTPLGFFKAIGEHKGDYGILQIDAHCDLRDGYEGFKYSHASIMYNALAEVPQLTKLVQVGIRDYCEEEADYIRNSNGRVETFFDKDIKERQFEGETWKSICDSIVATLPQQVFISFDIDGLDPKLCPHTGTPVAGGFEAEQIYYLFKQVLASGRQLIGFDLNEVSASHDDWDANVGARVLFKLCNLLVSANS
ncbi:agmatinase family protein [Chitinophaga nivalis]|uniref:Agmatinase family protein n=1 Tax=Chitinophaga nivalis TaxID=2991709 RepID=A0ABT3II48_9BACT|nr:agmatinase family protein [Chitinophaga nivalis]MCW3466834.1 agmatinase family protein [Chitinophaga nivalis]MCW3483475.1 agmatinase family protein [Chitinophaga nivalis]